MKITKKQKNAPGRSQQIRKISQEHHTLPCRAPNCPKPQYFIDIGQRMTGFHLCLSTLHCSIALLPGVQANSKIFKRQDSSRSSHTVQRDWCTNFAKVRAAKARKGVNTVALQATANYPVLGKSLAGTKQIHLNLLGPFYT